jgi:hypothetical protein
MDGDSCQKPYYATGNENYREHEGEAKAQLAFVQTDEPHLSLGSRFLFQPFV